MQTLSRTPFTTVKTEGGILPADLLSRVAAGAIGGLQSTDYHLAPSERLNEAVSRSWNRLLGVWRGFDDQRRSLPEADRGTTLTRERWLLILLQELGYGRPTFAGKLTVEDGLGESHIYPISHLWQQTPIHLVSFRQELDRRDPAVGRSPHSLLQEFLNRWDASLWGFASNGLRLRLLRDNASLTRAAYVEFDLEAMMAGELYSDFTLLWLVCHQSRVERLAPSQADDDPLLPSDDRSPILRTAEPGAPITDCWLERWSQSASEQGARALDALRDGVQEAISALGMGFVQHPANGALRAALKKGELSAADYYRELLRLVYRLIFLFVAEDRELLLLPDAPAEARERYRSYSVGRLRELAAARRGSPHADLYRGLRLLFHLLRGGYAPLGLPGLGGFLFSARATPHLDGADIANRGLLDAIRSLALVIEGRVRRPVDYRNLDTEELGSVYESLLELHPQLNVDAAAFALEVVAGSERKTTGTHYTPTPLVNSLLDTALEPVVAERLAAVTRNGVTRNGVTRNPEGPSGYGLRVTGYEHALLSIKVLDYACGSGHMLIGAGRRLARHLARIRTGDDEPAPEASRAAMRDVARHCLYGVDINEMAVELCKVALWMETLQPGKPLSFLDKNIQCGNSLLGVAPGLDISEAPDDAFQPLTGDDRKTATALRARNRRERGGQGSFLRELFAEAGETTTAELEHELAEIEALDEDDLETVALKAEAFQDYLDSPAYRRQRDEYDLWSAAFFWPIPAGDAELMPAPTQAELDKRRRYWTENDPLAKQARQIAQRHRFFHWELAFPTVFRRDLPSPSGRAPQPGGFARAGGEGGGFDVVLSNPPWERIKLQEKEWFASRSPEIAAAANAAARKRMIAALQQEDPALFAAYLADLAAAEGESAFIRASGKYPLCGRGDVNTYAIFAELARQLLSGRGRAGIITPSGIATDDTTRFYFQEIMESGTLVSLYDFENRRKLFPAVDSRMKFCLLTLRGEAFAERERGRVGEGERAPAQFVFFALGVDDLRDPQRRFTLSAVDIALLNPNTRTCPIFRSQRDAELTKSIYRRVPVLIREGPPQENPWGVRFSTMFHMSNDSHLFRTREQLEAEGWRLVGNRFVRGGELCLPLYEAKMAQIWDHRAADVVKSATAVQRQAQPQALNLDEHRDPTRSAIPLYWVLNSDVTSALVDGWVWQWLFGFTNVSSPTNERSFLPTIIPFAGVGNSFPLMLPITQGPSAALLASNLSSHVFDFVVRQKMGGVNLNFFIVQQLPVELPVTYTQPCPWSGHVSRITHHAWLLPRVLELTYTAWDLLPFAQDVLPALGDHPYASRFAGHVPPPFRWDEERRFLLRCELDAAYFHLYGIGRDDVAYILETFPIVKRKELARHGEYRTQRVILEIYDAMQQAMESGQPYQTRLDPPPADPRVAHEGAPPGWVEVAIHE